jgi:hypothetical protein
MGVRSALIITVSAAATAICVPASAQAQSGYHDALKACEFDGSYKLRLK